MKTINHNPPIYLPKAKKLTDLFSKIEPYEKDKSHQWSINPAHNQNPRVWCHTTHNGPHRSFLVTPTPAVTKIVQDALAVVFDPNIYFSFCVRDDDTVLVVMQYNQIIGSRWLCVLPASAFGNLLK